MATYKVYYQYEGVPDYLPSKKSVVEAEDMAAAKSQVVEAEKQKGNALSWINAERALSEDEVKANSMHTWWDRPEDMGGGVY